MSPGRPQTIVRVGIIGCGEITQVGHIPTLGFLSDYFQITYLCDVSDSALAHCAEKTIGPRPQITRNADELCASPTVDVVIIASSDPFHMPHTLLALRHNKVALVEKPMALSLKDADAILEAEKKSSGKVMVGYMRRYAAAFLDAVKEIGGIEDILYARVRDIVGPNSAFVAQSGTFPKAFADFRPEDTKDLAARTNALLDQALAQELGIDVTPVTTAAWRNLGSLGSHDLSAMREILGMPIKALGASMCAASGPPFWSALFQYPGFVVSYESGIDGVNRFDASIEIFGRHKTVKVVYDTPYVKGLPTTMHVRSNTDDGGFVESVVRRTYEDPYTLEMKELYAVVTEGKQIKTTAADAKKDLEVFGMFMEAAASGQHGSSTNGTKLADAIEATGRNGGENGLNHAAVRSRQAAQ